MSQIWKVLTDDHGSSSPKKDDKACPIFIIINRTRVCYNAAIMQYERTDNGFLCIGLRGFIYEGLSGIAPVVRR